MGKPLPREFRDEVVAVALAREPGVTLPQVAAEFGISPSCLRNWLARAEPDERAKRKPADTTSERELKKRIRLLEQENEILRRAAAYLSRANLPEK